MYCLCVNVYCHRVTTQLLLINISFRTKKFKYIGFKGQKIIRLPEVSNY
jgi:hypothetical protein